MQEVLIIGGKGTAINIAEQIEDAHKRFSYPMRVIGFAIDDLALGGRVGNFPVLCGTHQVWNRYCDSNLRFLFALYRPDVMRERVDLLRSYNIPRERYANFIHPLAYVAPSVKLGFGNVIFSHSCLQHSVSLGDYNIINSQVVIEHEASLGNSIFVAANACIGARAKLGTGIFVGLNSTLREDVTIADYAFIGMGSVVLQHISTEMLVYGVPARAKT